jgi:hypothetical protein
MVINPEVVVSTFPPPRPRLGRTGAGRGTAHVTRRIARPGRNCRRAAAARPRKNPSEVSDGR